MLMPPEQKGGMSMPRLSKSDEQRRNFEFWQGGKPAESVVERSVAQFKRRLAAEIAEKISIERKAARYLSQLQTPVKPAKGETAEKALKGLRALTSRLPKPERLPKRPVTTPVPVYGEYTLIFTPRSYVNEGLGPYSVGQVTSQTGNPTTTAVGNETIGQMTCAVETNQDSPSSATATNLLGIFFKPNFPHATAKVSFDASFLWSYYVNSIRNKKAIAQAQALLELYEYTGTFIDPPLAHWTFIGFSAEGYNDLGFDARSGPVPAFSISATVNSKTFYAVVVRLTATASASGWPGSLAGASAMVTVPSIQVDITSIPPVPPIS
jgi:hypothetical protein